MDVKQRPELLLAADIRSFSRRPGCTKPHPQCCIHSSAAKHACMRAAMQSRHTHTHTAAVRRSVGRASERSDGVCVGAAHTCVRVRDSRIVFGLAIKRIPRTGADAPQCHGGPQWSPDKFHRAAPKRTVDLQHKHTHTRQCRRLSARQSLRTRITPESGLRRAGCGGASHRRGCWSKSACRLDDTPL